MGSGRPPVWILIRAHLRGAPKKTAVLIVLTAVLVIVYVRLFLTTDSPQEASAADQSVAVVPPTAVANASAFEDGPVEARTKLDRSLTRRLSRNPFTLGSSQLVDVSSNDSGSAIESPGLDLVERIYAAAAELVLESTIVGSAPLASISGRGVRPGDEIDGFVLERVEQTQVVLRQQEIRVVLPLR